MMVDTKYDKYENVTSMSSMTNDKQQPMTNKYLASLPTVPPLTASLIVKY